MMKRLLLGGLVRRGSRHSARLGVVFLAAVVFALVVQGKALAATAWYVSLSGADSNSCAVPAAPCLTIDGAIGKAAAGDTVDVAVGTYTGTGTDVVTIDQDLTLSGGWNNTFTQQTGRSTIDGQNARRGVLVASTGAGTVTRFEVMNGAPPSTIDPFGLGGGILMDGPLTLDHSYVHDNVDEGVETTGAPLTITNSTISGNHGGGVVLYNLFGDFTIAITNSTIVKNTDSGINLALLGGSSSSVLTLNFDTIAGNSSTELNSGGGITAYSGWDIELENTIVSGNTAPLTPDILVGPDSSVTSGGYNIGTGFSHAGTDIYGDPVLGPLIDNGGPTPTMALLSGSPAIDAIPPGVNGCGTTITTDQHDVSRPRILGCDIGAFELERPPNDDFAAAQDLTGPVGIVDGATVDATKEAGEPDHAGDPGGSSIWYRWTAPASGRVTFSTSGSDFDTLLAVYTGSAVDALTEVASNDDANGLLTSEINFDAVQGTTYSIAIDGAGGDAGASELFWGLHPPNDNFAAAQLLSGDRGSVDGTTVGATKEPSEPNHAGNPGGASVWYRWTAPATGTLTLDTCDSDFDTLLAAYTGADVAHLTAVASNDDGPPACGLGSQVAFSVHAGTAYDIAVDGFDGDWGDFVLAWTRTKANQTIVFGALPNRTYGDPDFTLGATASSGLPVTFAAGGNCTVSGTTVHITGAGSCTITASQPGNADYNAAPDVARTFSVAKAAQTITFSALSGKTYGDADFTLGATASSGLPVTFAAGGNCTVSGTTVHITGAGSCTITASQPGNADYNTAPDVAQTFMVAKAHQRIAFARLGRKAYGSADFTVRATASSGLHVSFAAGGTCRVRGAKVHLTRAGSCTITASQHGNADYAAAASVSRSFAIACRVPDVIGDSLHDARAAIITRGCITGNVLRAYSSKTRVGRVSAQSRRPGILVKAGTRIDLVVSRGRRRR